MHDGILVLGLACVLAAPILRLLAEFVMPIPSRANNAAATTALIGGVFLIVWVFI